MKLRLNCKTHDGRKVAWVYDNTTNELWDEKNEPVDLKKDDRLKIFSKMRLGKAVFSTAKQKKMSDLRIQLGLKCNMHCKYCAQSIDRDDEKLVSNVRDVPKLLAALKAGGIDCNGGVIEFWGGEPFVYWKPLLVLIPALREMYPQAAFAMITNGTLLTEDKIDFCEKYGVSLTFSHDGQGYRLRGADPLDDQIGRAHV